MKKTIFKIFGALALVGAAQAQMVNGQLQASYQSQNPQAMQQQQAALMAQMQMMQMQNPGAMQMQAAPQGQIAEHSAQVVATSNPCGARGTVSAVEGRIDSNGIPVQGNLPVNH